MEKDEIHTTLTKKLFTNLVPFADKRYTDKYISYFMRLLNTRLNVTTNNEGSIMNLILDRSSNLHCGAGLNAALNSYPSNPMEKVERIQNLYNNLSNKNSLKRKWAVLYLLLRISQDNKDNMINDSSKVLQTIFNEENLNSYMYGNYNNQLQYENIEDYNNEYNIDNNEYNNSNYNPNTNTNLNNQIKEPVLVVNPNKSNKIITEKDLINDLIFIFQGIDGHYINYNSISNSFCLNPLIPFNDNITDIVSVLSELGWLYRKVNNYLKFFNESNIPSQFIQSFSFAIQAELSEYYR